jgi:cyanophycin synthetase
VTDLVHPEVAAAASLAARIVGLDIAGVDLVAQDISRPLAEQGGAIVEVNAGPGLLMHLKPADGQPRLVGMAIVDSLFPADESGRIPVVGITGTNGTTVVAQMIAKLIHLNGHYVGLACSDGQYLNQRLVDKRDCATWASAQKLLMNRMVEAAVIENSATTILTEGLGYDRCQVGVVTNINAEEHFGQHYLETHDQVYNVFRTQVDVVLNGGVAILNADDPIVAKMAELCDGEVIFFSQDPKLALIEEHLKQGGRTVSVEADRLVLSKGSEKIQLNHLKNIPLLSEKYESSKKHSPLVENVLAAVGGAWALDISPELISAGIETFRIASQIL